METTIKRTVTITPTNIKVVEDKYGRKLTFDCQQVVPKTIKEKREELWEEFSEGMPVEVGIAEFMEHEFIATAQAVIGAVKQETPPPTPTTQKQDTGSHTSPPPVNKTTDQRIAEQVAIKEIGLCWRSGRMTEAEKDEMSLIERYKQWLLQNTGIWVVEKDK